MFFLFGETTSKAPVSPTEAAGPDDDADTEQSTVLQPASSSSGITERLGATVMNLVAENVALAGRLAEAETAASSSSARESREDPFKMEVRGGKLFARPTNPQEIMERARRDIKNMKDSRRKMRKAASSKAAARPAPEG